MEIALAIWGAAIATILAIKELAVLFFNKPKIKLNANFIYQGVDGNVDRDSQTIVKNEHGNEQSVSISISCANSGTKSLQITSIFIEGTDGKLTQITPVNIPTILEPRTQVETQIQKEWFDINEVKDFGVLDALGHRHSLSTKSLEKIREECKKLPSSVKKFKHKDTGEEITAFQILDPSTVSRRTP